MPMNFEEVQLDSVPQGTLVYNRSRVPLGIVRDYLKMNGNSAAKACRHLDNGKPSDRFVYRREILYSKAQEAEGGMVLVVNRGARMSKRKSDLEKWAKEMDRCRRSWVQFAGSIVVWKARRGFWFREDKKQ